MLIPVQGQSWTYWQHQTTMTLMGPDTYFMNVLGNFDTLQLYTNRCFPVLSDLIHQNHYVAHTVTDCYHGNT